MTLLELHTDLTRTNELLERVAVALERLAGPVIDPVMPKFTHRMTDERDWSFTPPQMIAERHHEIDRRANVEGVSRTVAKEEVYAESDSAGNPS